MEQAVFLAQATEQTWSDKVDVAAEKAFSSKSYWQLAHCLSAVRSLTHAHALTGDQAQWQDASEALLCLHPPPSLYHFPPPCMPLSWGAPNSDKRPQGLQSLSCNDNWPLTACLRGTTTPQLYVFIPLHSLNAFSPLFFFFFNFVSLRPTALCDSGCWLKQSPLKLAVPVSPLFDFDPKAGDLH